MHKVIVINLNGNAYQLDEMGYDAVRDYLDRAQTQLHTSPDVSEIMADLEQAIAEKCQRFLGPHKTVVSAGEIDQILVEMGPVEPAAGDAANQGTAPPANHARPSSAKATPDTGAPKRLYRIDDGAMLAGVCTGLAAYSNIDVTLIRIAFVILAFFTNGIAFVVYGIMMVVIPPASTSEEHAAAEGRPFNAQEVVDWKRRWKGEQRRWRRLFRRRQREWRSTWPSTRWSAPQVQNVPYTTRVIAGTMLPVMGLIHFAMMFLLIAGLVTLVRNSTVFGWPLPPRVPLWVGVVGVVILYRALTAPLRAGRYAAYQVTTPWAAAWSGVVEMLLLVLLVWFGYQHLPPFRDLINSLLPMLRDLLGTGGRDSLQAVTTGGKLLGVV
jgi:phage shock protein PspC (stress-responsive transcriptional regulator)